MTPVKAVELPDCELAAKHFVSQNFWTQEQQKPQQLPTKPSEVMESEGGLLVRGLGKSEVFVPQ